MKPQTSTDYSVDNRRSGAKISSTHGGSNRCGTSDMNGRQCATDNAEGKHFLNRYIDQHKAGEKTNLTQERKQDNRFTLSAMGGTIPIGSLGLGQEIRNTDTVYSFKNAFGSPKAPAQKRIEKLD